MRSTFTWGQSPTMLSRLSTLPMVYSTEPTRKSILFSCLLNICFEDETNKLFVNQELNLTRVINHLQEHLTTRENQQPQLQQSISMSNLSSRMEGEDEEEMVKGLNEFSFRFPFELWKETIEFLRKQDETNQDEDIEEQQI